MSTRSADAVRKQYQAFEDGGLDAVAQFWDPEIEWRAVEGAADDVGPIRGPEALRRYYEDWLTTLDDLRADVEAVLFDEDDRVVVVVRHAGRGRASGVPVEGRYYVACLVRDGRILAGREYGTEDEALEAVARLT